MTAQQLKNSILQLAVQGKLVPQNSADEPASVLLECIKTEKEQLIKSGKIKKSKPLAPITDNEIPFDIPNSWALARLDDIGEYRKGPFGSSLTKSMFVSKSEVAIKVYEQKNAIQKNAEIGDYYITKEYFNSKMRGFEILSGDIIVSCAGTIGETYIMPDNIEQGILNQALMRMRITPIICMDYFLLYFDYILKRSAQESSKGSAIKNIPPFEIFKKLLLPLPPLAEQHRIVAKIEELLPLVEEYGEKHEALEALNKAFTIDLKKSILQSAVQGKLVEQDSEDEPASVLLERIRKEKAQLVKAGKIKKSKLLPPILDDDVPFDLPSGWVWCRLDDLCEIITKGSSPKWQGINYIDNNKNGILFITSENVGSEAILLENRKFLEKRFNQVQPRSILKTDDILTNIVGASIGRSCIYNLGYEDCNINQAVALIRLIDSSFGKYIIKYLNSSTAYSIMLDKRVDTARANISLTTLACFPVPLPPLSEQHRIVARVEELLGVVGGL